MAQFKKLFEPIKVGNVEIKNRLKLSPMGLGYATEYVTDRLKNFYIERAKGGVGAIGISLTERRLLDSPFPGVYDDRFIPGLRELVDAIHAYGAKAYGQLAIGYAWSFGDGPVEFRSPSGISPTGLVDSPFRAGGPYPGTTHERRALSKEEIHQIVEQIGEAARRIREAGFVAVDFCLAVGYILSQFLSPVTNKREDEYGGPLENRMRITLEVIESIKKRVGEDFPITCRISRQFTQNGITVEDLQKVAIMLEKAGIAGIDVLAGWHDDTVPMIIEVVPQGAWVHHAEAVKKVVKIPVGAGTRIQDPLVAERVLAEGKADMIYMPRALLADPQLPNKLMKGELDKIRYCIACGNCYETVDDPRGVTCTVNARAGREGVYTIEPVEVSKKVLVIGGGPAGMEASRVAALRGHKVMLYDRNPRLGGSLLLAGILNKEFETLVNSMTREIKSLPIEVKLGKEVTPALLEEIRPDVVILASGGIPPTYDVPGVSGSNVISNPDIQGLMSGRLTKKGLLWRLAALFVRLFYSPSLLRWLLRFPFPFKKGAIIIGGGFAGCELGEFLLRKGKKVTIVEESKRIGFDIGTTHKWYMRNRLKEGGANIVTEAVLEEISRKGVKVNQAGVSKFLEGDTVMLAKGLVANEKLAEALRQKVPALYVIGDCATPAKVKEAIESSFHVAREI